MLARLHTRTSRKKSDRKQEEEATLLFKKEEGAYAVFHEQGHLFNKLKLFELHHNACYL